MGPVEVWAQERRLDLGGRRQLALLAYLVLHANRAVSSDSLIDGVWETAGAGAQKRLQMAVARLRKVLETADDGERRLRTVGGGYLLTVAPEELDADLFRARVREGRVALDAGDPARASELLGQALSIWRGPPLADVSFAEFAQADIRQLDELRLEAIESRIDADLALGRHAQLVGELEALRVEHPARERVAGLLMLALYRCGRQSEALGVYQRLRAELLEQLGLDPGPELSALQARILEQSPVLALEATGSDRAPEGMVALLFTDIEGSTRLATNLGDAWPGVLEAHHSIVATAIADERGFVDGTEGDAFFATFTDPRAAARAAVAATRSLRAHDWPEMVGELRVRMGLHVGHVQRTDTGYVGLEIHRAARVAGAAHGGQLLVTAAARELVGDQLETEPLGAHRLKDFPSPELLFCAVIDGRGAAEFPPPRTESVRLTNLPAGRPELVGRDGELRQVVEAFESDCERLVTITGRGGAGKTSLALLAGTELLDRYPGGVWWIDLTRIASPDEVAGAIASVLGAEPDPESSVESAVTTRLRHSGPTLLVLDNMEHVLAAAGTLDGLLDGLPDVRLLVSSRVPLRIDPERVIGLDALDDVSGLELITRTVQRRGKRPTLTDADGDTLREIVHMLDGLPLALLLAAARLSVLTAAQLRDRLRESIDVLGEDGGRPRRQRSLRAALDSTLSLLDRAPRALFVRMGAFAGPAELDELERVLDGDGVEVLAALAELVDVALVQRVETGDGTVKFGLPEALRQLASELLDREPDGERWRHAHAQRQYEILWAIRTVMVDRKTFLAAHGAVQEAGAALRWVTANHGVLEQPLAAAYALILLDGGRVREAGAITERLIASPPADAEVRWLTLCAHSLYLGDIGQSEEARLFADQAYGVAPDAKTRSAAVIIRAIINQFSGRTVEALQDSTEGTALARELDDDAFLAGALGFEAQALMAVGSLDEAAARLDEARTIGSAVDANCLYQMSSGVGDLAIMDGRPADALEPYAQSLERSLADGRVRQIPLDLSGLAEALAALGHDAESLEMAGMAERQNAEIGAVDDAFFADHLAALQQRIGPAKATELKQRGRADNPADRVARACQLARSHAPAAAAARE